MESRKPVQNVHNAVSGQMYDTSSWHTKTDNMIDYGHKADCAVPPIYMAEYV